MYSSIRFLLIHHIVNMISRSNKYLIALYCLKTKACNRNIVKEHSFAMVNLVLDVAHVRIQYTLFEVDTYNIYLNQNDPFKFQ